jgi:hypothetical protein
LIFGFVLIAKRACWFVWHRFAFLLNLILIYHRRSVCVPATEAQCSGQVRPQILISPARARQLPATCLFVSRCCSCSVKDLVFQVSCWLCSFSTLIVLLALVLVLEKFYWVTRSCVSTPFPAQGFQFSSCSSLVPAVKDSFVFYPVWSPACRKQQCGFPLA